MALENTLYVIGDVHGCFCQLKQLHQFIRHDSKQREASASIIFLGDLIDRGPNSKDSVELVYEMINEFKNSTLIMGNHDEYFFDLAVGNQSEYLDLFHWVHGLGGYQTLLSYDDRDTDPSYSNEDECQYIFNVIKAKYRHHLDMIQNASYYKQLGGFVFAHAGIERNLAMKEQRKFDLVWIREGFLDNYEIDERLVIHGHTPILTGIPEISTNRVGIDTCAFHIDILTCMVLDPAKRNMSFYQADQNSVNPNPILPEFIGNTEVAKQIFDNPFQFEKVPPIDANS